MTASVCVCLLKIAHIQFGFATTQMDLLKCCLSGDECMWVKFASLQPTDGHKFQIRNEFKTHRYSYIER